MLHIFLFLSNKMLYLELINFLIVRSFLPSEATCILIIYTPYVYFYTGFQ